MVNSPRVFSYLLSIGIGIGLALGGMSLTNALQTVLLTMSGVFLAAPAIDLIFTQSFRSIAVQREQDVFGYVKMNVDRDLLNLVVQLSRVVQPYEAKETPKIDQFLKVETSDLEKQLQTAELLGFQVLKKVTYEKLDETLKQGYLLEHLPPECVRILFALIQHIKHLEHLYQLKDLYLPTGAKTNVYHVVSSTEMGTVPAAGNERRYVLLKTIGESNQMQMVDVGAFEPAQVDRLLFFFRLNEKYLPFFAEAMGDLLHAIRSWLELTNGQFMVDPKMYQLLQTTSDFQHTAPIAQADRATVS